MPIHHERYLVGEERAKELILLRAQTGLHVHSRPWSTYVAAMGNYWRPGCREAVERMTLRAVDEGFECSFVEIPDMCYQPYDALGTMRNLALGDARSEGFEYICYVDNDVVPPEDALIKLLSRQVPAVVPLMHYSDGKDYGLKAPTMARNQGLAVVRNTIISFVLFRVNVFNSFETFWGNAVGEDEGYHWDRLYQRTGIMPFLDTDVDIEIIEPPHFPLDRVRTGQPRDFAAPKRDLWTPKEAQ